MQIFVINVWEPVEGPGPDEEVHGVVRHVRTGREATFAGDAALLSFIRLALDDDRAEGIKAQAQGRQVPSISELDTLSRLNSRKNHVPR